MNIPALIVLGEFDRISKPGDSKEWVEVLETDKHRGWFGRVHCILIHIECFGIIVHFPQSIFRRFGMFNGHIDCIEGICLVVYYKLKCSFLVLWLYDFHR